MIRANAIFKRYLRDIRGATMIEFAFISIPLMMVLLGLTDFGYRAYVVSVVEGTVHRAARLATIGDKTPTEIDDFVRSQLTHFSDKGTVTITKKNYYQFSAVGKAETNITHPGAITWTVGDCYEDMNNNATFDQDAGSDGLGSSDDIVYYKVSLDYPRLIPLGGFFGWADIQNISANTLMRNQPYASQLVPKIRGGTTQGGNCP